MILRLQIKKSVIVKFCILFLGRDRPEKDDEKGKTTVTNELLFIYFYLILIYMVYSIEQRGNEV